MLERGSQIINNWFSGIMVKDKWGTNITSPVVTWPFAAEALPFYRGVFFFAGKKIMYYMKKEVGRTRALLRIYLSR